jgi:hypothetical protein
VGLLPGKPVDFVFRRSSPITIPLSSLLLLWIEIPNFRFTVSLDRGKKEKRGGYVPPKIFMAFQGFLALH